MTAVRRRHDMGYFVAYTCCVYALLETLYARLLPLFSPRRQEEGMGFVDINILWVRSRLAAEVCMM